MAKENKQSRKKRGLFSNFVSLLCKPLNFLFIPANQLIKNQIGLLIQDFKQEIGKKAVGLLLILLSFLFIYSFLLLLSALIIVILYECVKLKLVYSILIVMGLHALFVIVFLSIGISVFKAPMFNAKNIPPVKKD